MYFHGNYGIFLLRGLDCLGFQSGHVSDPVFMMGIENGIFLLVFGYIMGTFAGGATVSTGYALYLFPAHSEKKYAYKNLEGVNFKGVLMNWKDHILYFSHSKGNIYMFSNSWYCGELDSGNYKVEIRLHPKCDGMCF